jgi:hypothetical protein
MVTPSSAAAAASPPSRATASTARSPFSPTWRFFIQFFYTKLQSNSIEERRNRSKIAVNQGPMEDPAMFKLFWRRFRRADASRDLFAEARYAADPLSHPVLKAMTARELADMPFPRPGRGS